MTPSTYETIWSSDVAQDCINLNTTLAEWLAERLFFLSKNTHGCPASYIDNDPNDDNLVHMRANARWREELATHAQSLAEWVIRSDDIDGASQVDYERAQAAIRFVADNLGTLWD